jgi:hypothetical protein
MRSGARRIQVAELSKIAEYLEEDPPGNGKVTATARYRSEIRDPPTSTPLVPAKSVTVVLAPSVWRDVGATVALPEWVPTSLDPRLRGIAQYTCKIEAEPGRYVVCAAYDDIRVRPTHNDIVHVRRTVRGQYEDTLRVIHIDTFGKVRLQQPEDSRASLDFPSTKVGETLEVRGLVVAYYTVVTF